MSDAPFIPRDVLEEPDQVSKTRPDLSHANTDTPALGLPGEDGRIVTVVKSAGGCGASVVATNLAGEFCRQTDEAVALIDLDIQFGNLGFYLDIRPRHTLLDALQAGKRFDETFLKTLMEVHETGIHVLSAPRHMVPLDQIDEGFILKLIRLLKKTYPVSVIELSAGWAHWFGVVFSQSDEIVVVCEPTVRGASGLARVLQSLQDMMFDDISLNVIANKVQKYGESRRCVDQMQGTVLKPIQTIRYDEKSVEKAISAGMLLSQAAKRSIPYRDMQQIAGQLLKQMNPPGEAELRGREALIQPVPRG